jgi:hypothetical protein
MARPNKVRPTDADTPASVGRGGVTELLNHNSACDNLPQQLQAPISR